MFERIVVPLDGTDYAERALPVAARIAHATNGVLLVVSVVLPMVAFGRDEVSPAGELHPTERKARQERASRYLDEVLHLSALELEGIKTEHAVVAGAASSTMFEEAVLQRGDLIVLWNWEESGLTSWIFRCVARQVVRHTPVPVLVLNEHGVFPPFTIQERLLRVLIPLDGSPMSETALQPALWLMAALAGSTQTVLHLPEVVNPSSPSGRARAFSTVDEMVNEEELQQAQRYLHEEMSRLLAHLPTQLNLTMTYSVAMGTDVAKAILAEAEPAAEEQEPEPYDLIAMTTHGWGEPRRQLVGSVTEQVLGATRLPLLILRSPERAVWEEEQSQSGEVQSGA